jgi:hypothetical protein
MMECYYDKCVYHVFTEPFCGFSDDECVYSEEQRVDMFENKEEE